MLLRPSYWSRYYVYLYTNLQHIYTYSLSTIFSIDTTVRLLFVVFFHICKMRLSLSSYHTVWTSFLLCIRKNKNTENETYFKSTKWLPRNLNPRKQCTLNFVAIEVQPGMVFNARFVVFHGLQFSWLVVSKKGLFWVYCYIKIIREVIHKYYSNYQML